MKKNFEQPALEVVRIKKNDIVTTSPNSVYNDFIENRPTLTPGQRGLDDWDAGY